MHIQLSDSIVPLPLNSEDAMACCLEATNGDINAQNTLIVRNLRIVLTIINTKYGNTSIEYEDLFSIGVIGLIKAARKFNINVHNKFFPFAEECVNNEIRMYLRKKSYKYFSKFQSYDELLDYKTSSRKGAFSYNLLDNKTNDELTKIFEYEEIRKAVFSLPATLQLIITLRYGFYGPPLNQKKVGVIIGLSQSQVSRIEKQAICILRQIIIDNEMMTNRQSLHNA